MDCIDVRNLLTPYVDRELDIVRSLEVEEHLRDCQPCAQLSDQLRAVSEVASSEALRHQAPAGLRERILATLPQEKPTSRLPNFRLLAAASLLLLALSGWGVFHLWQAGQEDPMAREVVSNHVRSLMADHLVDVKSSDRHKIKPWFQGKLAFSPPVPDLAEGGFPLVGGRLDYLGEHPVAAIVYRRREHQINLFVRRGVVAGGPFTGERQGYHVLRWSGGAMTWWAVSDLNEEELREFVKQYQNQVGGRE